MGIENGLSEDLKTQLNDLPKGPGVYLMKGKAGQILYIGKALSLADRVRSYFHQGAALTPRLHSMLSQVRDIEPLVTQSELEALILENNLIKKHRPKYNVLLRDDKNYPFLRLPLQEDYPRLQIVRRVKRDGALYFGPYVPTNALRETLRVLRRVFPLPNCKIKIDGTADRPCIEFEIKRCLAPCTGHQSREQYREMIRQVRLFLEGKDRELVEQLTRQMDREAERLNFEEAARLRDTLSKVQRTLEKQRVASTDLQDQDVFALSREGSAVLFLVLFVRGGMLIGRKDFCLDDTSGLSDEELYASILQQFYAKEGVIPPAILLPVKIGERELLERWLSERRGAAVRLHAPARGKNGQLLRLARENAALRLKERLGAKRNGGQSLEELRRLLHLKSLPRRVEAFDISNIGGDQAVGSMVVCTDGRMDKSEYRRFRIRAVQGANDFAMLQEVLGRRYAKAQEKGGALPDLVLIDGGKGQLSAALEVLEGLHLGRLEAIGLAKARDEKDERVFLPGAAQALVLPRGSAATHLLQRIRDEAHRFAITYHRKLRGQEMAASLLDEIEGIGEARKRALLRRFGSLEGICRASLEDLERVPELGKVLARKVFKRLSTLSPTD